MIKKERFKQFIDYFSEHRPIAETELDHGTAYEMLVATILSAQCTDKRVNMLTPAFFKRYPGSKELAKASQEDVFDLTQREQYRKRNEEVKHDRESRSRLVEEVAGNSMDVNRSHRNNRAVQKAGNQGVRAKNHVESGAEIVVSRVEVFPSLAPMP